MLRNKWMIGRVDKTIFHNDVFFVDAKWEGREE